MKKNQILISISTFLLIGCLRPKNSQVRNDDLVGTYILKSDSKYQAISDDKNYSSLEIHTHGTYILNKAAVTFTPVIEQCDYASKGKWSVVTDNLIEITSENYYQKQKGFEYQIKKENKFSQDSLYIQIDFPSDLQPLNFNFNFNFNHNNSKSITTDETFIALLKSQHLMDRETPVNQIGFSINAKVSGTTLYRSRIMFDILNENVDTEEFNFLTISLPNFDRCFFEFEPYKKELILIRNKNQLFWKGEKWERMN